MRRAVLWAILASALFIGTGWAAAQDGSSSPSPTSAPPSTTSAPSSSAPPSSSPPPPGTTEPTNSTPPPTSGPQASSSTGSPPHNQSEGPGSDPEAVACYRNAGNDTGRMACADAYCSSHMNMWCANWCRERAGPECPRPSGNATPVPGAKLRACIRAAGDNATLRQGCIAAICQDSACGTRPCEAASMAGLPCRAPCLGIAMTPMCRTPPCPPGRERTGPANGTRLPPCVPPVKCAGEETSARDSSGPTCRYGQQGMHDITFQVADDHMGIVNFTVNGNLVLAALHLAGAGPLVVETMPHLIVARSGNESLVIHDNPTGLIEYRGTMGVHLTFPPAAAVTVKSEGLLVSYADGRRALVVNESGAQPLGNLTYSFTGHMSIHVPLQAAAARDTFGAAEAQVIQNGIEDKRVAAIIQVGANRKDVSNGTEVMAFGDMNITVSPPAGFLTADDPLRVRVSSEIHGGRTIVLKVNRTMLTSLDPSTLQLRYFDVGDNGVRSEVLFKPAPNLTAILDPASAVDPVTGIGQPEYYVVQDQYGLQVLVSIPHFSAHEITIASVLNLVKEPSVVLGLVGGVVGTLLLGTALFARRPRDEE
ncbi:MAG: hypothetical protein ACYDBQ_09885 [Thermoplasmatota archaeon]